MNEFELAKRYDSAVLCLNNNIRKRIGYLNTSLKAAINEIRLRTYSPIQIVTATGNRYITEDGKAVLEGNGSLYEVTKADMEECFRIICGYSVHTHQNDIVNGFITLRGGHRAGLCGTAVLDHETVTGVKEISSINLRIAREINGIAEEVISKSVLESRKSLLLSGPPCSGKTTVLRDLARWHSQQGRKVAVIDERGEIAAMYQGKSQNYLGHSCDILNGYPKPFGIFTALRSLSPDVIICDEIGMMPETEQILQGLNSGVQFVVTAHADCYEDLLRRPQIKRLLDSGEFEYAAILQGGHRLGQPAKITQVGSCQNEDNRTCYADCDLHRCRTFAV